MNTTPEIQRVHRAELSRLETIAQRLGAITQWPCGALGGAIWLQRPGGLVWLTRTDALTLLAYLETL